MMLQDFDKMSQFVYDSSLVPRPALFLLFFFNNTQERKTFQYMGSGRPVKKVFYSCVLL